MMNVIWLFNSRLFQIRNNLINANFIGNRTFHDFPHIAVIIQSPMVSHQSVIHQQMKFGKQFLGNQGTHVCMPVIAINTCFGVQSALFNNMLLKGLLLFPFIV